MDTEKELQLQRFKIIEPFLRKEKKLKEMKNTFHIKKLDCGAVKMEI